MASWLSEQTHSEQPWLNARGDLGHFDIGNQEITQEAMALYYDKVYTSPSAEIL